MDDYDPVVTLSSHGHAETTTLNKDRPHFLFKIKLVGIGGVQ